MNIGYAASFVGAFLELAVAVAGAVLVGVRCTGGRRVWAILGFATLALTTVLRVVLTLSSSLLFRASQQSGFGLLYGGLSLVVTLVGVAGLLFLVIAFLAREPARQPQQPYR